MYGACMLTSEQPVNVHVGRSSYGGSASARTLYCLYIKASGAAHALRRCALVESSSRCPNTCSSIGRRKAGARRAQPGSHRSAPERGPRQARGAQRRAAAPGDEVRRVRRKVDVVRELHRWPPLAARCSGGGGGGGGEAWQPSPRAGRLLPAVGRRQLGVDELVGHLLKLVPERGEAREHLDGGARLLRVLARAGELQLQVGHLARREQLLRRLHHLRCPRCSREAAESSLSGSKFQDPSPSRAND
mmetsp:Transcript_26969/g.85816  ORF Transcript_26969/g.85816 Transcript_26969/m.85816 type:complete len:246 (+) Transcript_26969:30-767(+)